MSSEHRGGEHEGPAGSSAASRSRASSRISTLSASTVPAVGEHAPVVGEGGGDEALGVTEVGGPPGGVEEGVAEGGVAGLALGGAEPDGEVDAQDRIGVVGLGVEVEGLGVVAQGVAGGEGSERGVGRPGASSRGPWPGRRVGRR